MSEEQLKDQFYHITGTKAEKAPITFEVWKRQTIHWKNAKFTFQVGFHYFPHEEMVSSEYTVNGTYAQAQDFLNAKMDEFEKETNFDIHSDFCKELTVIQLQIMSEIVMENDEWLQVEGTYDYYN